MALLVAELCVGSVTLSAHAEERISPEARAYFKNGVELLQADPPNYQDAYYQFKLAYEKSQSWKVLGNYGLCAVKLERDGEALSSYTEYLRRGGDQIDADERQAIERDMLLIKGNGSTVELTSKLAEFDIQDSRSGSTVGSQSYPFTGGKLTLFLRAGAHRLTATAKDGRSLTWEVNLQPGRTVSHDFDFDAPPTSSTAPEAGAVQSQNSVAPAEPPAQGRGLQIAGFVTAGVGVLALGGGVVTGLMAKSKESDATGACDANKVCPTAAESSFDDAASLARTTNILLIGGGVLTAAGLGMVVFGRPSSEAPKAARVTLVPVLSSNAGGVFASGRF
jgi:hypothetical protein